MKTFFTKTTLGLIIASIVFLYSCSETDPLPISQASFIISSIAPEVDVPVKFENQSLNASVYAWDFGDGTTDSLTVAPEHVYEAPGNYLVKLTAYTEDGQKSEAIEEVSVGERHLTGMYIFNIPMTDPEGNPWDEDGSGPDVLYQLGPIDAQAIEDLVFVYIDSLNVGQFQTPIGITIDDLIPENYLLSDKEFFILLEEVDTVENEAVFTPMAEVVFNPIFPEKGEFDFINISKFEDSNGQGFGDIIIPGAVLQEYQFMLDFEIK